MSLSLSFFLVACIYLLFDVNWFFLFLSQMKSFCIYVRFLQHGIFSLRSVAHTKVMKTNEIIYGGWIEYRIKVVHWTNERTNKRIDAPYSYYKIAISTFSSYRLEFIHNFSWIYQLFVRCLRLTVHPFCIIAIRPNNYAKEIADTKYVAVHQINSNGVKTYFIRQDIWIAQSKYGIDRICATFPFAMPNLLI